MSWVCSDDCSENIGEGSSEFVVGESESRVSSPDVTILVSPSVGLNRKTGAVTGWSLIETTLSVLFDLRIEYVGDEITEDTNDSFLLAE